jgi:hypothetical protein
VKCHKTKRFTCRKAQPSSMLSDPATAGQRVTLAHHHTFPAVHTWPPCGVSPTACTLRSTSPTYSARCVTLCMRMESTPPVAMLMRTRRPLNSTPFSACGTKQSQQHHQATQNKNRAIEIKRWFMRTRMPLNSTPFSACGTKQSQQHHQATQ